MLKTISQPGLQVGEDLLPVGSWLVEHLMLKQAILHRKNALFFKTLTGAHVGDLFMSLIHTCELEGVNPFAYLLRGEEMTA